MNDYFLEKIDKINEKIPETNKDPLSYTKRIVEQFPRIPEMRLRRVPMRVKQSEVSETPNQPAMMTSAPTPSNNYVTRLPRG